MSRSFAEAIKKYRIDNNLSQEKLGEILGCSSKTISRWEHGVNEPDLYLKKKVYETININGNESEDKKNLIRKEWKKHKLFEAFLVILVQLTADLFFWHSAVTQVVCILALLISFYRKYPWYIKLIIVVMTVLIYLSWIIFV